MNLDLLLKKIDELYRLKINFIQNNVTCNIYNFNLKLYNKRKNELENVIIELSR